MSSPNGMEMSEGDSFEAKSETSAVDALLRPKQRQEEDCHEAIGLDRTSPESSGSSEPSDDEIQMMPGVPVETKSPSLKGESLEMDALWADLRSSLLKPIVAKLSGLEQRLASAERQVLSLGEAQRGALRENEVFEASLVERLEESLSTHNEDLGRLSKVVESVVSRRVADAQLVEEQRRSRLAEEARRLFDVVEAEPEGLLPGAQRGEELAQRVRELEEVLQSMPASCLDLVRQATLRTNAGESGVSES